MEVKRIIKADDKGRPLEFRGIVISCNAYEENIILKSLKLYLDYNPRKERDKPDYEQKKTAVDMIETIKSAPMVDPRADGLSLEVKERVDGMQVQETTE